MIERTDRDWLLVTPQRRSAWIRLVEKPAADKARKEIQDYRNARLEYAIFLRESGLTFKQIGHRLGISATNARTKVVHATFANNSNG